MDQAYKSELWVIICDGYSANWSSRSSKWCIRCSYCCPKKISKKKYLREMFSIINVLVLSISKKIRMQLHQRGRGVFLKKGHPGDEKTQESSFKSIKKIIRVVADGKQLESCWVFQ